MMLTVQITIGSVEADRKNGSSQSRYHGYTTGAHKSDAAIGQANASEDHAADPAEQVRIVEGSLAEIAYSFDTLAALSTNTTPLTECAVSINAATFCGVTRCGIMIAA